MIARAECPHCCAERLTIGVGRYLVCPECGLSYDHVFAPRERCTSADLALAMAKAEQRWLWTALRRRMSRYGFAGGAHHAGIWRARYMARAVSLAAFWGRNWKARLAR